MILFDTSVWVDHFGPSAFSLAPFLESGQVMMHALVLGEIAMGSLRSRSCTLLDLSSLPQAGRVSDEEVLVLIESRRLFSRGIGLIDVHLLASAIVMPPVRLRTSDRRLAEVAAELGVGGHVSELST